MNPAGRKSGWRLEIMSDVELHSHDDCRNTDSKLVCVDTDTSVGEHHSPCFFDYLPGEMLLKIFSYFSQHQLCRNIAPVCRRWRDFAYDPIHWRKLELYLTCTVDPEVIRKLFDRTDLLKRLVLSTSRCVQFAFEDCCIFGSDMQYLEELHLTYLESLDVDSLKQMLQRAPRLEHLNIEGCVKINDCCIEKICLLGRLIGLNLSHCLRITDIGLTRLAEEIKCLKLLNIDGMSLISERPVKRLVEMHFQHLQHLYLDGEEMTDLRCISCCSELQTLSVSYATNLEDSFLASIINLSNLKALRLRKGDEFTASALRRFFENTSAKKLTDLDLSECSTLDDRVLAVICMRYGLILNKLVLSWCWEITDVGLEAIVSSCRVLHHLNLIGLHHINGLCFQNIPDLMPCLTFVDLTKCNQIDDDVLTEVVGRKTDFAALNYYGEPYQVAGDR